MVVTRAGQKTNWSIGQRADSFNDAREISLKALLYNLVHIVINTILHTLKIVEGKSSVK
jgi:hypothetical protein